MTDSDKTLALEVLLAPNEVDERLLAVLLSSAETIALNRLYPFGWEDGTRLPERYHMVQVRIAAELWFRRGSEGETSHSENDTYRYFENGTVSKSLLNEITPMAGSVLT